MLSELVNFLFVNSCLYDASHAFQMRQYSYLIRIPEFINFGIIKEIKFPILLTPLHLQIFLLLFFISGKPGICNPLSDR